MSACESGAINNTNKVKATIEPVVLQVENFVHREAFMSKFYGKRTHYTPMPAKTL